MGSLSLPSSGLVYLDTNPIIYSVEKHPEFASTLLPVWQAAAANLIEVVSSELVLLELLVGPLKSGNSTLVRAYEDLFHQPQTRLLPITRSILKHAAELRANLGLKTPDAIHAATALQNGCKLIITNDVGFRRILNIPVAILADIQGP